MPAPLLLATRNEHKLDELGALLVPHRLAPLPEDVVLPPETGATFAANALGKARAAVAATGRATVADDSGLCASALDGAPGVRSARFAGEDATDAQNVALLLDRAPAGSGLEFVCVLVLVEPDGREEVVEGRCSGRLAPRPRGRGGFGYDPVFLPDEAPDGRSMAELSAAEKGAISHRGVAARALQAVLDRRALSAG